MSSPKRLRLWVVAMLALLALPPTAPAFSSLPHGDSPHDTITARGAEMAGWDGSTKAIREAVRIPDLDDHEYDPQLDEPGRIDGSPHYSNAHHCGRGTDGSDAEALDAAVAYTQDQRAKALGHLENGSHAKALAALGRALHNLQDCFSHSNIVDLDAETRAWFAEFVVNGTAPGSIPEGLNLTGFDQGADEPGMPADDPYPHDKYAKDEADKNDESSLRLPDGRSKYEAARDMATNATAAFLTGVREEAGEDAWEGLQAVEPDYVPKRFPVPGFPVAAALIAVGVALWVVQRKPPT